MKREIGTTLQLLRKNIKCLLLLELLYKAAFFMVMLPVCRMAFKLSLRVRGFSYLTLENVAAVLRGPVTILSLLVIFGLAGFFQLLECSSLIVYNESSRNGKRLPPEQYFFPGLIRALKLLRFKKNLLLPVHSLLLSLFMILPLIVAILTQVRIPSYVLASALTNRMFVAAALLLLIAACIVSYWGMFVLQLTVRNDCSFREAYKLSRKMLKGRHCRTLSVLAVWNLLLILFYFILYYGILFVSAGITYYAVEPDVIYTAFLRVYEQVSLYVGVFVAMTGMVANLGLFTVLYSEYCKEHTGKEELIEELQMKIALAQENEYSLKKKWKLPFQSPYRRILIGSVVVVIGVNLGYIYDNIRNGSMLMQETLLGTYVTAHRGASADAPENTIPALEKAIERMADYAEIDVRETKDGVVVLLHDASLKRTTGNSKLIWDVPYMELMGYDAGAWFSKEFEGTKIPTLSEVLSLCKGRINLNIEIKLGNRDQGLVEKVVRLIEQYNFQQQCVISSANYSVLAKVKELKPELKTGYILSLAYGNFYNSEYADFFSVKSSFINDNMVRLSHRLGKEVHAWTVNTRAELERMKQLGVDNIITDKPLLASEILDQETEQVTFLGMFKKLLDQMEP